jgi:hypothetical protein
MKSDVVFWLCVTLMVVLLAGDPDLLGAIVARVANCG